MTDPRIEAAAEAIWQAWALSFPLGVRRTVPDSSDRSWQLVLEMAAAAVAAADLTAWRPHKTAPKDGTAFLVCWFVSQCHGIVVWNTAGSCWITDDGCAAPSFDLWSPLPAIPAAAAPSPAKEPASPA